METTKVGIGDKITIPLRNHRQFIKITGTVKEIRNSYGNEEYLLTETTTTEFWTRKKNVEK